jgi:hypothetical protein
VVGSVVRGLQVSVLNFTAVTVNMHFSMFCLAFLLPHLVPSVNAAEIRDQSTCIRSKSRARFRREVVTVCRLLYFSVLCVQPP